jgi:hypothetical protein
MPLNFMLLKKKVILERSKMKQQFIWILLLMSLPCVHFRVVVRAAVFKPLIDILTVLELIFGRKEIKRNFGAINYSVDRLLIVK